MSQFARRQGRRQPPIRHRLRDGCGELRADNLHVLRVAEAVVQQGDFSGESGGLREDIDAVEREAKTVVLCDFDQSPLVRVGVLVEEREAGHPFRLAIGTSRTRGSTRSRSERMTSSMSL